jgi:hypothetical protein
MSYRKIITSLQRFVDKYLPFGSEEWWFLTFCYKKAIITSLYTLYI